MIAWLATLALVSTSPTLTFAWDAPSVGTPDHYIVTFYQVGYTAETYTTTQPSITLPSVPGRDIRIRVAACSGGACGAWSQLSQKISLNRSADLTGDSVVGVPDYWLLQADLGETSPADLTGDGVIGVADLGVWDQWFGECIGPVSVEGRLADAYLNCDLVLP